MIRSKRKEVVIEGIFKIWISIFGTAGKFLVDNGGEFDNEDFRSMCENLNIRICTLQQKVHGAMDWLKGIKLF